MGTVHGLRMSGGVQRNRVRGQSPENALLVSDGNLEVDLSVPLGNQSAEQRRIYFRASATFSRKSGGATKLSS
jgi:hypothetical protein